MFHNFTLLYVEDEAHLRDTVTDFLEKFFHTIYCCENGQEGLETYKNNSEQIDMIITDINMPKMNGLIMAEEIKKINTEIPIIITTAHTDNQFLFKAIDIGVSKFITKPINVQELFHGIKLLLEPIMLRQQLALEQKQNLEQMVENEKFSATGKLAAGITHEINTPLTYIKANLELMEYDILDIPENETLKKNVLDSLGKVNEGVHRIETIINSMKEISSHKNVSFEKVNIYNTILTAATIAWNKIKHICDIYLNGEKFSLSMEKDKFDFFANVQVQRIEQVWIIIINNALDELVKIPHFKNRKLEITIENKEDLISIQFKDNAGGIKDSILDDIFKPFKSTKDSSGMGVGLSIAKKIIDDHKNASITASNSSVGAVFEIKIAQSNK